MKRKPQLMALVRRPDGTLEKRPVKEPRATYKVTDSLRDRLSGDTRKADIAKAYYHHQRRQKK